MHFSDNSAVFLVCNVSVINYNADIKNFGDVFDVGIVNPVAENNGKKVFSI